jgi:hypothetical protein
MVEKMATRISKDELKSFCGVFTERTDQVVLV